MGLATLGTFHKRQGDQSLLTGTGLAPGIWARLFGQNHEQEWSPTIAGVNFQLAPRFDGYYAGLQTGLDILGYDADNGSRDRFGVFFASATASGDVIGYTLARRNNFSGKFDLDGNSVGGYFTHIGPNGWYLDAVGMHTWFDGDTASIQALGIDLSARTFTASLEGGYPMAFSGRWAFEPQVQIIWQETSFEDRQDLFSSIDYDDFEGFIGRLGFRLGLIEGAAKLKPYLLVNLWQNFSVDGAVTFNDRPVTTELDGAALEVGGGISVQITQAVSTYGTVSYTSELDDDEEQEGIGGTAGLRLRW
jgi:outer membrane autotransporter protein